MRRAVWAWQGYVTAGKAAGVAHEEVRYERLVTDRAGMAATVAEALDIAEARLRRAFEAAFASSVGRFHDLDPAQLAEAEAEAGILLREQGNT